MIQYRYRLVSLLALTLGLMAQVPSEAASLQAVSNWGASGVPSYISMYIYVPDKPASNPPILVVSHFCGGSASAVFGQAQTGGIVAAADKYGFIMIFPQTTNPATSAKCWDVGSSQSLKHDGGGDTQAVAQMVKYTVTTYQANANRVYATGDSSGGMMTEALLAVYPDIFKAGSAFAGVPAGCWSLGWSSASNWGGECAGNQGTSTVNKTAQQWGDLVRAMYPSYTGPRPRVQLFHGDGDKTISYTNQREAIKEWTNVLGLSTDPTSTDTGLTLGTHQATRQRWKNSCGQVVLEAITSLGGDHGPSDALFNSTHVVPFLGLDQTGAVDPVVAQCSAGGAAGSPGTGGTINAGGSTAAGGALNVGGTRSSGGSMNTGGVNVTGGTKNAGGSGMLSGGSPNAGGKAASGGTPSTGGTVDSTRGGSATSSSATGGSVASSTATGSSATGGTEAKGGMPNIGTSGSPGMGGTTGSIGSSTIIGGATMNNPSSPIEPHPGGTGNLSDPPAENGTCNCHLASSDHNHRGSLGALLAIACAAGLRRRRNWRS